MSSVGTTVLVLPGGVRLSESEWRFVYSRSPGPGGQNVNKVNSRVTLLFDVGTCAALSPAQKCRIIEAFPGRVSQEGTLRVVSSRFRTQAANRNAARLRFAELLTEALTPAKPRKQTTLPDRARVQRLANKAHRSQQKHLRRRPAPED